MAMNSPSEKKKVGFFVSSLIFLICWFVACFILAAISFLFRERLDGGKLFYPIPVAFLARYYIVKAIEKRKNRPIKTLDPKEAKPLSSLRTRN